VSRSEVEVIQSANLEREIYITIERYIVNRQLQLGNNKVLSNEIMKKGPKNINIF
jgi:hypothetical protein